MNYENFGHNTFPPTGWWFWSFPTIYIFGLVCHQQKNRKLQILINIYLTTRKSDVRWMPFIIWDTHNSLLNMFRNISESKLCGKFEMASAPLTICYVCSIDIPSIFLFHIKCDIHSCWLNIYISFCTQLYSTKAKRGFCQWPRRHSRMEVWYAVCSHFLLGTVRRTRIIVVLELRTRKI